jgi:L-alanine-DL-glutamate epimerase-like enolase superfamily enzyme
VPAADPKRAERHRSRSPLEACIKLAKRLEKFTLGWMEAPVPWQMTDPYVRLALSITAPIGTGEAIYLKENVLPLLKSCALAVIHPDVLTAGGILENKKIGDLAEENGVAMVFELPLALGLAVRIRAPSLFHFAFISAPPDSPTRRRSGPWGSGW